MKKIVKKYGAFFQHKCTIFFYLKPTAACQTNASKRKNTGITGATSIIGLNIAYASGNLANNNVPSMF